MSQICVLYFYAWHDFTNWKLGNFILSFYFCCCPITEFPLDCLCATCAVRTTGYDAMARTIMCTIGWQCFLVCVCVVAVIHFRVAAYAYPMPLSWIYFSFRWWPMHTIDPMRVSLHTCGSRSLALAFIGLIILCALYFALWKTFISFICVFV